MTSASIESAEPTPPSLVIAQAERLLGRIETVERLGGMSGSRVLRARGERGRAVVKGGGKAAETEFYEAVAPVLAARGGGVPNLLWAGTVAGERWLIIEEVPAPLPRERWGADPEVLAALARIHTAGDVLPPLRSADAFQPVWSPEATGLAMQALRAPHSGGTATDLDDVAALLTDMRSAAAPLFAPACPLSGDPNPANWGLRADGSLVLFDWERYCRGTPALDLAAIVPGLGTPEDFGMVAEGYADALTRAGDSTSESLDIAALAREIVLAKAWNVVELLAGIAAGHQGAGRMLGWLRGSFPDWVRAQARG